MGKCLIVSGGNYADLKEPVSSYDLIIACDRGFLNARKAGITPHLLIGDFDSYEGDDPDISVIRLPVRKDDTDTMAAVKYAFERGFNDITISCVFGGRFDHSLANIQTAAYIVSRGGCAELIGADTYACAFTSGKKIFKRTEGYTLSVFSLSDKCEDVCITGALYGLSHAELTGSFPIGVSNDWAGEYAGISVGSGTLLVMMSRLE